MPSISQTVLNTILGHLAVLFLAAAGEPVAAKNAAAQTLAAYNAQTEEELCRAAEIISFSLHGLEALAQAADPELSVNQTLRLRGSAVSLSREAHKAQRKLDQLQRVRDIETQPQPAATVDSPSPEPRHEREQTCAEAECPAKPIVAKSGGMKWSQADRKRELVRRMAENAKKNQARHAAALNATASNPGATQAAA